MTNYLEEIQQRFDDQFIDKAHSTWKYPTDIDDVHDFLTAELSLLIDRCVSELEDMKKEPLPSGEYPSEYIFEQYENGGFNKALSEAQDKLKQLIK